MHKVEDVAGGAPPDTPQTGEGSAQESDTAAGSSSGPSNNNPFPLRLIEFSHGMNNVFERHGSPTTRALWARAVRGLATLLRTYAAGGIEARQHREEPSSFRFPNQLGRGWYVN